MPLPAYVGALRKHVGHDLLFLPAVCMVIFNDRAEVLLGKRSDNGKWALLGGIMEPGDTPAAAAIREAKEEAGIDIEIDRVSGVDASGLITYPNGDAAQYITVAFRCRHVGGEPRVNDDESTDMRFFSLDALPPELSESQRRRIADAMTPGSDLPAKYE